MSDTHQKIELSGLNCASCVARAETALRKVPGVDNARVNLANQMASFQGDVSAKDVQDSLARAGYPARTSTHNFAITGMHCASCVGRIEDALLALPGVLTAEVNLASRTARIVAFKGMHSIRAVLSAIESEGYHAEPRHVTGTDNPGKADETRLARQKAMIASALALPVFLSEMGGHLFPAFHHALNGLVGQTPLWIVQCALTTLIMVWPGLEIYRRGLPLLLRLKPDMNSLVAMGTLAAWIYSALVLLGPQLLPDMARNVYFEAAAVILALILLGRWLEARARGQAGAAIKALLSLQAPMARLWRAGAFQDVALDEIQTGDLIEARPGDRIAADGEIVSGESTLDESMMTGESRPIDKSKGDMVLAGTLNGSGVLTYRVTKHGDETALARIVGLVEDAQAAKLPVQSLADQVVRVFVPAVILIAVLAVVLWLIATGNVQSAMIAGVSVLIIACPCAMGLATPMSVMVGTGRAASLGVLFRKGDALQTLESVKVIAFDKTGTLTTGKPQLVDHKLISGWDYEEAIALAAALEAKSEHPLATAIVKAAQGLSLPEVNDVKATIGQGLSGRAGARPIHIGSARFMTQNKIDLGDLQHEIERMGQAGTTPVILAVENNAVAVFALSDVPREDARDVVSALGIHTVMLSGDRADVAQAVGQQIGIDDVYAELSPEDKTHKLAALRQTYGPIAFVGDGINDAPSLAKADVGIAMGSGTETAIESAEIILTAVKLESVKTAIDLSHAVMRNIRQNLFWAFAYNVALIPVAAGVLYPAFGVLLSPMLGAGAMALSSVFVISNALRLRRAP